MPEVPVQRKLPGKPGRVVAYVITTDGPEPVEGRTYPLAEALALADELEHVVRREVDQLLETLGAGQLGQALGIAGAYPVQFGERGLVESDDGGR